MSNPLIPLLKVLFPTVFPMYVFPVSATTLTAVGVGLAAVGTAATVVGQVQAGNAADAAAARSLATSQKQAKAIAKDYKLKLLTQKLRMQQLSDTATNTQQARLSEAEQIASTLKVAAGEANVGGNSINKVINQDRVNAGLDNAQTSRNRMQTLAQAQLEMKGMKAQAESGMMAANASVLPSNNWGATLLGITGTVANSATNYVNNKPK